MELVKQKYVLHVRCEHDESHTLTVPMTLDGSETTETSIERFKDALIVTAHAMMEHHGRSFMTHKRIDGIPSQQETELYESAAKLLGLRA